MLTKADGSLLFTPNNREARRYRRAVDVVVLLAAFWSFCFSLYFFVLIRCLCHAAFLVLFIVFLLSYSLQIVMVLLLFWFGVAFEIDLGHVVGFFAAVVVFVVIPQFVLIIAVIAQHTILDIGTNSISTTLRREANLAKHAGVLILFANNQTNLSVFHGEDSCRVAVTTFHEADQTIGQAWLQLSNVFACRVANKHSVSIDMQLHTITDTNLRKNRCGRNINQLCHTGLASLFNKQARINTI